MKMNPPTVKCPACSGNVDVDVVDGQPPLCRACSLKQAGKSDYELQRYRFAQRLVLCSMVFLVCVGSAYLVGVYGAVFSAYTMLWLRIGTVLGFVLSFWSIAFRNYRS